MHTFELTGVKDVDSKHLTEILGPAAGFAQAAEGSGGVLYGTPRSLRAAADAVTDETHSPRLAEMMTAVRALL
jgi:hypothetical protein